MERRASSTSDESMLPLPAQSTALSKASNVAEVFGSRYLQRKEDYVSDLILKTYVID